MTTKVVRIAINGVTGRMGYHQHLVRSILEIRAQGGVEVPGGARLIPEPVLLGRNAPRLEAIAARHGIERWSTDLDTVLGDPGVEIYFDTQLTSLREKSILQAIAAGKHVYAEKPVADSLAGAIELVSSARRAGIIHGVVQDKLFLPGVIKLRRLIAAGLLGRLLSVRLEFGYWVFDGRYLPAQRPSWNYRKEEGGGITPDMLPHWRYLVEDLFGPVEAIYAREAVHVPERWDEAGRRYEVTAEDSCYAILELRGGIVASVNSSWAVRVNRKELLEIQVDGTEGSAVAGLRTCTVQSLATTPKPVWNPDLPDPLDYPSQWAPVPDNAEFDNAFKQQWELYLRAVATGEPFRWDLSEAAKGVQLAELAARSSREGRRVDVPDLGL
jgi:predicted dehydrogenase